MPASDDLLFGPLQRFAFSAVFTVRIYFVTSMPCSKLSITTCFYAVFRVWNSSYRALASESESWRRSFPADMRSKDLWFIYSAIEVIVAVVSKKWRIKRKAQKGAISDCSQTCARHVCRWCSRNIDWVARLSHFTEMGKTTKRWK